MTLKETIVKADNILIIGHQRPDGDCIGAGLALRHACINLGKQCDFTFDSSVPQHFSFVPDFDALARVSQDEYDLVMCVDCADNFRMGKFSTLFNKAKHTVNIDHHITNNRFAELNFIVPDASSTCEILFDLLEEADNIDDMVAYYLYIGLSTDTGHFMHSNTTPHVFEVASKLAQYNISPYEIARDIYKNATVGKVKLISRAINSMRFFADGKICLITVTPEDLTACDCVLADTEGIIDYGMMIGTVDVAVCITQHSGFSYKVSFRSKNVDVAAAAGVFGGGGHKLAAGCTVSGRYEDVVAKVVKAVTDGMPL